MNKKRLLWIVLDSVGAGEISDAAEYGDAGASTLEHISETVGLHMPVMRTLGLGNIGTTGLSRRLEAIDLVVPENQTVTGCRTGPRRCRRGRRGR